MTQTVNDIMTHNVIHIKQDDRLTLAIDMLDRCRISGMPVTGTGGTYVGVLSKTDFLQPEFIKSVQEGNLDELTVADVMNKTPLITVGKSASISDAKTLLTENRVHRLFVRDDKGEIVGVVSSLDISRYEETAKTEEKTFLSAEDLQQVSKIIPFERKAM